MVTAKNQSEDVVEAFRLGANDYVTKPIDFPVVAGPDRHARRPPAGAGSAPRERDPLRPGRARHQRRTLGLGPADRAGLLFPALEGDARLRGRRDRHRPRRMAGTRPPRRPASGPGGRSPPTATGLTPQFQSEHRMLHKDETYHWMLSRGVAVQDAGGQGWRMAGSQTDITAGKGRRSA